MKLFPLAALAALTACAALPAAADEGMWTFDNPPTAAVREKYGVALDPTWLDRVRQATVRLDTGCTGSFISGDGLILTNHHCAEDCIAEQSSEGKDLVAAGFLAATREEEPRCGKAALSVLMATEEITAKVAASLEGIAPAKIVEARRAALTKLEQACEDASKKAKGGPLKCEQVTLYQGGQYWLYKYKRYDDVRLAFAPERGIAAFGGDPDNFQFPRWCLDMSILRAYENGRPAKTPTHLRFAWNGAQPGDPVFVSGHPGSTDRLLTVAELEAQRNAYLPLWLLRYSELRGRLIQYSKTGEEPARTAEHYLNSIENAIKVRRNEFDALLDPALIKSASLKEQALRDAAAGDPSLALANGAWDEVADAQSTWRNIIVPYTFLEGAAGFNGNLFEYARKLVRAAAERGKPNEQRLREYTDARLPAVVQSLKADVPIYPDLEEVRLSFGLERMREWLGPDDEVVHLVLARDTPDMLADRLVHQSTLADAGARMALYEGGQAAIDASHDPLIRLAVAVDPASRALRKRFEEEVQGPTDRAQEQISKVRFAKYGTSIYPDATFTLRLSYGAMKGWVEKGQDVRPWTELSRLYERATGEPPFRVPPRWLAAKDGLDLSTRTNFTTDNDITGGNSGSPMLNAKGEIVGLAFDGNIHSIAGSFWFDERMNRTVGVHPAYIRTALEKVYDAKALLEEIDRR